MTYCVAIKVKEGLVLAADTRTNAGVDHVSSFRKMHVMDDAEDRVLFLQTAGNLATTQSVITVLEQQIKTSERNVLSVSTLFEAAELVGQAVRGVIKRDMGQSQGVNFSCHILLSGQIDGEEPRLFHVYPEGNFIEATEETAYFQIGESKYGKPILDRVIDFKTPLDKTLQCALISMDSTLRSNISVGLPIDVMVYKNDRLNAKDILRIDECNKQYNELRTQWAVGLKKIFDELPMHFKV